MKDAKLAVATAKDIERILDEVRFGGFTLVKNYSMIGAELTLYALLNYTYGHSLPVIVEDIFDAFVGYVRHFEVMGLAPPMDHVGVLKVGGIDEVGNVFGKLQFEADPLLYIKKKERAVKEAIGDDPHVYIITGFERLLGFQRDIKSVYAIASHMREELGNEKRLVISIVEGHVIEGFPMNPLPLLEGVATSVIELHDHGDVVCLDLKKSVFNILGGTNKIFVRPADVVGWC